MDKKRKHELEQFALRIRIGALEAFAARGFGHVGGSMSVCDALAVLYGSQMRIDPKDPTRPDRDKLVCSKGHAGPAVYAVLALKGYFPYEWLKTLNQPGTKLPSHCDRSKTPGIDMTTGSLGQGTSLACGMALGDRLKGYDDRIFLIVGDGETNEGQVWEAAQFAVAKKLSNLVWLIDENKKQLDGFTKDILPTAELSERFRAFGFDAVRVKGDDVEAIDAALERTKQGGDKPYAIVLDTVKGAGIPEVEQAAANHGMTLPRETWLKYQDRLKARLDGAEEGAQHGDRL